MRLTPAIAMARKTIGYRPPVEDDICCATCGAIQHKKSYGRRCYYYCRFGKFHVHSRGVCKKWFDKPFVAPEPSKPPFTQEELFK